MNTRSNARMEVWFNAAWKAQSNSRLNGGLNDGFESLIKGLVARWSNAWSEVRLNAGLLASFQLVGLPGDGKMGARLACSGEFVATIEKRWRAGLVMTKS